MKIIKNILIVIYALIAIFATVCLLSINQYRVTELGEYTFIYVDKHTNSDTFAKGDLAVVSSDYELQVGDEIFFYNAYEKNVHPVVGKIMAEEVITEYETTYTLDNEKALSSQFVIGKVEDSIRVPFVGSVMKILESKWGFLFLIVLPVLLAFIYEIYSILVELKASKKQTKKSESTEQDE